MYINVNIKYST